MPPCAFIISSIFLYALPLFKISKAILKPEPFFALPAISSIKPAIFNDFFIKSLGPLLSFLNTHKTSLASKAGPMPLPIGSFPSVTITLIFIPNFWHILIKSFFSFLALSPELILEPLPVGISTKMCVADTEAFFATTEAKSCDLASIASGLSTLIILSSAGARFRLPPQTMQPFVFLIILFIFFMLTETFARTSIVSAVPAGLVMLLELVFGIVKPAAAIIGTITIVVLLPATPPTQCLSITGYLSSFRISPCFAIAFVRRVVSSMSSTLV